IAECISASARSTTAVWTRPGLSWSSPMRNARTPPTGLPSGAPGPSQGPARSPKFVVIHRAMNTNILATAAGLSDRDLLARLYGLAGRERQASVELVAHLAVLDARPAV